MGLFGKVYKGTVKNLTVENFSSDGEIATTGVIAAYADFGATFENIAIFDCNPRVYNIGNGGIVGCVGWYTKGETDKKVTFTNITVDNSNKISALWGSWDVACGGIVGQYYPTSGQTSAGTPKNAGIHFENCHVAAQMDVYNDVCANYQYYAYRYTGMLIGSARENETIDGHSYPKMDGITAENCTVHFGTWNDYYYCEIIDNTTASYTHDYQMSRLTEIKAIDGTTITYLDGTTGTVPASGRANYVIVDYTKGHGTDNATCYHFKDGTVWTHDMGGIQEGVDENGDGQDDLKEDKQHIYLEFNNIVTGYGWGVTSKGLTDFEGVENLDITHGNQESSVEKFKARNEMTSLVYGAEIKVGDLFEAKTDATFAIDTANVQVFVSPVGENSTVSATYVANADEWTQGALTFSGSGNAKVTITDYNYCKETTCMVSIGTTDKFVVAFDHDPDTEGNQNNIDTYLYRVGNKNTVAIGSLFEALAGVTVNSEKVTVEVTNAAGSATGEVTVNTTTWTAGTIQFSGTGVVTVTISGDDATAVVLTLEVVDAKNTTTATSATANNVVLLNDISGSFSVSGGYALYGNGFTVTLPTTVQSKYSAGYVGYVTINDGNLDNVKIVGPVYPVMNIYREQAKDSSDETKANYFYNSVYINGGNCTISNSYISGSRTAICIRGGNNVTIDNTTISGGAVANIEIAGASSVTLRDLTTVQTDNEDSYGQNATSHGMGVYVTSGVCKIDIEGELTQRNWVNENQWNSLVGDYANFFPDFFGDTTYAAYQKDIDGITYVNLAMVFACNWDKEYLDTTNQSNSSDYTATDEIALQGYTGGVYSVTGTNPTADDLNEPNYDAVGFDPVAPVFNFDNTANEDADDESDAADTYCVYDADSGTLKIGVSGDSKTLDLSGVTVTKNGATLAHTAYLNGTQINGNSVTIKSSDGAKQTLTFKATSNDAGYDKDGNPIAGSIEYTWNVTVEMAVLSYPAPVWNMGGDYQFDKTNCVYAYYSTSSGYGEAVPIYEGIKINYYDKTGTLVNLDLSGITTHPTGSNNSNANAFTYTLADGSTLTMKFSSGWKSGATTHQFTTYNNKVYIYPQSLDNDNYIRAKVTNQDFNVKIAYTFTDPNGQSTETVTMNWYNEAASNGSVSKVQWKTFDSTNGKEPSCITPDTLITLAGGTQKRVDELTFGEKILAWDFFTGTYVEREISLLVNHGEDLYRIANLCFSDGSALRIIADHGVFDYDLNKYVYITVDNMQDYVGHRFVQYAADGSYNIVTLTEAYETEEYTSAWSVSSAGTSNAFASGLLTVAPPEDFYNWIEMGDKLMYDVEKFQKDVETYGLYTYEDFKDYVTYEQFVAWNGAYLKIPVEKGLFTFEYILELIELYKGWMP